MSAGDLVKHTATPWQSGGCVVWQAGGNAVADLSMSGKSPDQIEADAAFIVRAVNAHDDLVSVLQEAIYEITHLSSAAWDGNYTPRIAESTVNRWRSILAKAGVK